MVASVEDVLGEDNEDEMMNFGEEELEYERGGMGGFGVERGVGDFEMISETEVMLEREAVLEGGC